MAIEKATWIDQIEITRDRVVQVRFGLGLVENGNLVADPKWHRTIFEPGVDADGQVAAVNESLTKHLGYPAVPADEVDRLRPYLQISHTPEFVALFALRREISNITDAASLAAWQTESAARVARMPPRQKALLDRRMAELGG